MIGEEEKNMKKNHHQLSTSLRHVNYSCGSCGYQLNLSSCNRNTSVIGSKYGKSIKRGFISFVTIDETRFTKIEGGLFRQTTKLLCYKCGNHIGNAYQQNTSSCSPTLRKSHSIPWDGISDHTIYDIKLRALQPSFSESEDFSVSTICP